ncbi:hypothetical protein [Sandaracinobacteroides saxicola]|uniref:Uncharacterized protein n=1 Tax=Sandaracinobacteroides saxicola TaxID=2759707 RepID=A0A7G5IL85_9SPHN|nr:hypothetical protein [Sandaracinobacteroides saxicola]QMW24127.1 hypothetical protein H3309_06630 [Sandaracinobacteroides saxicola]
MDAERAGKLYVKFVQRGEPVNNLIRDRCLAAFAKWTDDVADAVLLFATEMLPCIAGGNQNERFIETNTLLIATTATVSGAALTPIEAVYRLCMWNSWFRQRQLNLKAAPIQLPMAMEIYNEINDGGWDTDAGFLAFCAAVTEPHRKIYDIRKAFVDAGLPKLNVYATMHFLQQNVLPITRLNVGTAVDIYRMSLLAPPLTAFAGFDDWGPGNHGSIAENKLCHFLKHVLDAHPLGDKQKLPWVDETAVWWRELNIRLTGERAQAGLGVMLWNAVRAHFPATLSDHLLPANAPQVVAKVRAGGGWPQLLKDWLVAQYADAYAAYALNLSRAMTDIIVHVDETGSNVNMKGVNGGFFLGGRPEGAVLGLSTCFYAKPDVNLKTVNVDRQIWQVSPL